MIDGHELAASAAAGAAWVSGRDVPDTVGWADLAFAREAVVSVLRERHAGGIATGRVHRFPLPKSLHDGDNRTMSIVDPFDELFLRVAVGRVVHTLDRALGPEVKSYRLADAGPKWTLKSHRYGIERRRSELREVLAFHDLNAVATFDIRAYYPSISLETLVTALSDCGVDVPESQSITTVIEAWQTDWGVDGLPIGPESSGVLGNVALVSVDADLRGACPWFTRYTDDVWVGISAGTPSFDEVRLTIEARLASLGLELNGSKVREYVGSSSALEALTDRVLDSLSDLLASDPDYGLRSTHQLLAQEFDRVEPDASRVRFGLSVLARRNDPAALAYCQGRPALMRIDPRAWGQYLEAMVRARRVDPEWMIEMVAVGSSSDLAAVQLHVLRALSPLRLPRSLATRIEALALESNGRWVPLRCAAAEVWGASERATIARASEATLAVGDAQHRRALTLGLRGFRASRRRSQALRRIALTSPECRPSVDWIVAGAPAA